MRFERSIPTSRAVRARALLSLACTGALLIVACGKHEPPPGESRAQSRGARSQVVAMCTLMPKEEVNAAIGASYTVTEEKNERTSSQCHYSTADDAVGLSLELHWIEPGDYSSPARHAAAQEARMGGAKLGEKLTAGMAPEATAETNGPMHIPSGPVQGVGDEAMQNMLVLTARKGDYVIVVVITPDMSQLVQDSTLGPKVQDNERTLARSVLGKV
jgi:hypothetical protein